MLPNEAIIIPGKRFLDVHCHNSEPVLLGSSPYSLQQHETYYYIFQLIKHYQILPNNDAKIIWSACKSWTTWIEVKGIHTPIMTIHFWG